MYPILFKFGFIQVYSYGLMVALAFFVSTFLLARRASVTGLKEDFFWNVSFWILSGGILGGRLTYIILNLQFFLENPLEIFMLWHGGLVWYGGLLGGILCAFCYIKLKKAAIGKVLDELAPFAALGQSIGRIGCLLNGCCYGLPAAWGVYFPAHSDRLIPAQLFSSLNLLAVFIILRLAQEKSPRRGFVFAAYLLLSSFERFLMEFFRNDSSRAFLGLTIFQIISAVIFTITVCVWSAILWLQKKRRSGA